MRALMQEELDGRLDESRSAALREHVASCDACRRDFELLAAVHAALSEGSVVHAPPGLTRTTMASIASAEAHRKLVERAVLWAGGAAAGAAAAATVVRAYFDSGVSDALSGAASRTLAALPGPPLHNVETPGLVQQLAASPSVLAVFWTLAVVGTVFVAVEALRVSRQLTFELR
jgi:anti-sigma factor RsiW